MIKYTLVIRRPAGDEKNYICEVPDLQLTEIAPTLAPAIRALQHRADVIRRNHKRNRVNMPPSLGEAYYQDQAAYKGLSFADLFVDA